MAPELKRGTPCTVMWLPFRRMLAVAFDFRGNLAPALDCLSATNHEIMKVLVISLRLLSTLRLHAFITGFNIANTAVESRSPVVFHLLCLPN